MTDINLADELTEGKLQQKEYINRVFERFEFYGNGTTTMEDVVFERCKLPGGTLMLLGTAVLRNVEFRKLRGGGKMAIGTGVLLDRVRFSGRFPSTLQGYVPSGLGLRANYSDVDWALDITDYLGEVSIYGPPLERIRCNPDRHVKVSAAKTKGVDWAALGVRSLSYWTIAAKRASVVGCEGTVEMIPSSNDAEDVEARAQLEKLRSEGILE